MNAGEIETFRGYPVKVRRVTVAGHAIELLGPANYDSLIDEPGVIAKFERDEYLPYWAEFWPVSELLAQAVAEWGTPGAGCKRLKILELGCGLGLVSLVAASLGHTVIASDYDEDALAFVVESARRNHLPTPETRVIDWREAYPDLAVDRIVAAEVLYETRHLRPVAEFVQRHLRPDGLALICDAHRSTADAFEGIARHCGLTVEIRAMERKTAGAKAPTRARIFQLRRAAAGPSHDEGDSG